MSERPATAEVALSVDHLFRRRSGQMVATLTRIFGARHLDLVEDVVQDALLKALRQWQFHGVPDNPSAWIVQVAKNRALDILRRRGSWATKEPEIVRQLESLSVAGPGDVGFARELHDSQLALVFLCCHPVLGRDARVALTLKLAGGFSVSEIARAFLTRRSTMAQRLVRAKRALRDRDVSYEIPAGRSLPERLDSVLEVLYLMFNEGYAAHEGEELVRTDLCREAIRLTLLLSDHPVVGSPAVDALAALLLFQGARLATRVDADGDLLRLAEQDRSRWDRSMMRQAAQLLARSGRGDTLTTYHLEAEIAACHALARDYASTDWERILGCYDRLLRRNPSPVIAVNRLVAVAQVRGSGVALRAAGELIREPALDGYYPAHVIHGELRAREGDEAGARDSLGKALELISSPPVRRYLERRIAALDSPADDEGDGALASRAPSR